MAFRFSLDGLHNTPVFFDKQKPVGGFYPDQAFHRTQSTPILGLSSQDDYGDKRTSK
jgi:hypothetical protein